MVFQGGFYWGAISGYLGRHILGGKRDYQLFLGFRLWSGRVHLVFALVHVVVWFLGKTFCLVCCVSLISRIAFSGVNFF